MSKNTRNSSEPVSPIITQDHSPDKPFYSLATFYETLLSKRFKTHQEAIVFCRDLCSNYGFTVKQEQSTHKSIYIYCSREGLPDSYRNPKVNPQRNRQSQRCECRWRIVLFENSEEVWEFRKSQNADAFIHNHPLLKPDEIKKEWPREVSEKIFELARLRLPTNEIRQHVRELYPDIYWDDRRFYNRLSEERQKMKQRDTVTRALRLVNLSAQICMVTAGSEDLSHFVESKLTSLLETTCKYANVDSDSIAIPAFTAEAMPSESSQSPFSVSNDTTDANFKKTTIMKSENFRQNNENSSSGNSSSNHIPVVTSKISLKQDDNNETRESKRHSSVNRKRSFETLPKGFLAVPISEHTLQVKMYSQNSIGDIRRAIFEGQKSSSTSSNPACSRSREPFRRRSRALFTSEEDDDWMELDTPAKKVSRQFTSSLADDELDDMSTQSSPSNSQMTMFAPTSIINTQNAQNANTEQQQQTELLLSNQFNSRVSSATPLIPDSNLIFENSNGNLPVGTNNNYLQQSQSRPSFSSATDNVYPLTNINTSNLGKKPPQQQLQQQQQQYIMFDPSSFVQHAQQNTTAAQIGIIASPSTPNHAQHERVYPMSFEITPPTLLRTQSMSLPRRTPGEQSSAVRPVAYPMEFSQVQNVFQESNRQTYYNYQTSLQEQSPDVSSIPPRPASVATVPHVAPSSQVTQHHYLPPQQQGSNMFSYSLNSSHQAHQAQQTQQTQQSNNVYSMTYMTNEQMMNLPKRRNLNQDNKPNHNQQQQQQQHLHRRVSGPN
ncbi:MAG: hypothetical protein EXX96DRAFT_614287 [Benjaminiella poitrasii]|nr:MAG: hypothetical protein EXX96DRAFT_614287 [Benjaminiella poitrasii]